MLLFVFLIATVNLAVGYALGAGLTVSSLLALLPERRRPEPEELDAEPLTRPAPEPPPVAAAESAPPAAPEPPPASPADVMASLSNFREKLSSASVELKLNKEDPERFTDSATKLQQANHDYLEHAEDALQQLDELGANGDTVASATRDAVESGKSELVQLSGEIDGLIDGGLDKDKRSQLIDKSEQMRDSAAELEESTAQAMAAAEAQATETAEPEAEPAEPASEKGRASTVESVDELFAQLVELMSAAEGNDPLHLAAIQVDPADGVEGPRLESLEKGLAELACAVLEESHTFLAGGPAMALLHGDSFEDASEHLERLRQEFAAATFLVDGEAVQATVTCALAEATPGDARQELMEQLELALGESSRTGPNQTYHHDGAFPTALPVAEIVVDPQTIKVS